MTTELKTQDGQAVGSSEVVSLLRVLWRTSGFLTGLAEDMKRLAPEKSKTCLEFRDCLEVEARKFEANADIRRAQTDSQQPEP